MVTSIREQYVRTVYKTNDDCVYGSPDKRFTDPVVTRDWTPDIPLDFVFHGEWFACRNPSWYYWPNPEIFRKLLDYTKKHFYAYMEIDKPPPENPEYKMRLVVRTQTAEDALMAKLSLVIDSYVVDQYK